MLIPPKVGADKGRKRKIAEDYGDDLKSVHWQLPSSDAHLVRMLAGRRKCLIRRVLSDMIRREARKYGLEPA